MTTKIVNLTPHPLVIQRADGTSETIESSGIARCATTETVVDEIDGIPVVRTSFGAVEGLPDASLDTVFVISSITAQAVPHRLDVLVPARPIRDEKGRIVACAALGRLS